MASAQLSATPREGSGKGAARTLRAQGRIPGVIYGHGREPLSLAIDTRELEKLLSRISAESTVIELSFDHSGVMYMFELRTEWYNELNSILEQLDMAPDDEDEDDETFGGYYSKN